MTLDIRHFENETILDYCPACLGPGISPYVVSVDYHYGIDGAFGTNKCDDCGSVFTNPMPAVSDLSALYPEEYYSFQPPKRPSRLKRIVQVLLRYPRISHIPAFGKPGTMLDVGCGAGHYMVEMKAKGWSVFGSELSAGAAKAGKTVGLDIRPGELVDSGFAPKTFDFIRSNHSFEHIPDPDTTLTEMRRLLKDDGKLFIGIPNWGGFFPTVFGNYWWNFGLPVHTFNYTVSGITSAMERHGFKIEKIVHNSDYSGLLGSIQIWRNAKRGIRRSDGKIFHNKIIRLPAHYMAKFFDLIRAGDCIEVIASKRVPD
jgi:SAM-dependent methyltransferase